MDWPFRKQSTSNGDKPLPKALRLPLERLSERMDTLEEAWKQKSLTLDAVYDRVHSELGRVSRKKREVLELEETAKPEPEPEPELPLDRLRTPFAGRRQMR